MAVSIGLLGESTMSVTVNYATQRSNSNGGMQVGSGNRKSPSAASLLAAGLDALVASVAIVDAKGLIVAVNDAWRRYADDNGLRWARYGIGYNYLTALDSAARDGDPSVAQIAVGVRRVLDGSTGSFRAEYACETPSGCQFIQDVTAFEYAGARHAIISHENVTLRKLTEDELRASRESAEAALSEERACREEAESRLRIAEAIADMLAIASSELRLEDVLLGMVTRSSATLGSQAGAVYYAEQRWDRPVLVAACGAALSGVWRGKPSIDPAILAKAIADKRGIGVSAGPQEPGQQAGGRPAPREPKYRALLVTPLERKARFYGYLVHFYAESRPFTENEVELAYRFAQQFTLALDNAEWRSQAEQAAIENERSRLARELHDAVTQTLFSTSVVAEALPRVWERDPDEGRRALGDLRQWTRGALAEMRTLLMELRPSALIDKPLPDLIRQLSEAASTRLRIPVRCHIEAETEPPAEVKLSLYRIAQEALNNIAKHSSASQVDIRYRALPQAVHLVISDNGRGFNLQSDPTGQMGLNIMRERARHVGAKLDILSAPGAGAEVSVEWHSRGRK